MPLDKDELSTIMSTESIYETFNSSAPTWKRHLTFHRMFIFPRHINILWMKTCSDRYIKGRSDSQMLMNFQKNSAFEPPPPALVLENYDPLFPHRNLWPNYRLLW